MPLEFYLPIGHPDPTLDGADLTAHLELLQQRLIFDGAYFAGDRVQIGYDVSGDTSPGAVTKIVALWPGAFHLTDAGQISLEMLPETFFPLKEMLGNGRPVPKRAVYGPLESILDSPLGVIDEGGKVIGYLKESSFSISLEDQRGYYLDPLVYFELFSEHNLWERIPADVRCPLVPQFIVVSPFAMAGPSSPAQEGQAYLTISGGSYDWLIHNPPDPLLLEDFSFLSQDEIHITLHNEADPSDARLRITDVSDAMYKTKQNPPRKVLPPDYSTAAIAQWDVVPQAVLKPHHKTPYSRTNGKRLPGKPLSYELQVSLPGPPKTLSTTISQDTKDVIRQEYVFHSHTFLGDNVNLSIPERVQIERNVPPDFVEFFGTKKRVEKLGKKSNYGPGRGNWLLNAREIYWVAEYMHRQYGLNLTELRTGDPDAVPVSLTGDLVTTSAWRNPERNERIPGKRRSNHQFGRALDLRSRHRWGVRDGNIPLNRELFNAGRDFLQALADKNGYPACSKVEILLERQRLIPEDKRDTYILWKYKVQGNEIKSRRGSAGAYKLGTDDTDPPANSVQALQKALRYATHVHIGWKPADETEPLTLPELPPASALPGMPFRNVILIAAEDEDPTGGLPAEQQIPLNHVAASIRTALQALDPNTPTEIRTAGNPFDYLQYCNAFRTANYKIRYFFSLSHGRSTGLTLTHYDDDMPYMRDDGSPGRQIHDADLYEKLGILYAHPLDDNDFDFTDDEEAAELLDGDFTIPIGDDDWQEMKTHEIRLSNLISLPSESLENMRHTFAEAQGIYIVGFHKPGQEEAHNLFARTLARMLGKRVYGGTLESLFYVPDEEGKWIKTDSNTVNRQTDPPPTGPILPLEHLVIHFPSDDTQLSPLLPESAEPDLPAHYQGLLVSYDFFPEE